MRLGGRDMKFGWRLNHDLAKQEGLRFPTEHQMQYKIANRIRHTMKKTS